jgi:hypothetical protein
MSPMDGGGPGRYSAESWDRTRRDALERPAAQAPPRQAGSGHSPATLAPGIVEMSLRGDNSDIERLLKLMDAAGVKAWRTNSAGTRGGNRVGFQYYSVEVPRDDRG